MWSLSDIDSNQLLSKPEFCLFMYLMHAIRNFGTSFRLPDQITPGQAARILGLEQLVRPSATAGPAAGTPANLVCTWSAPLSCSLVYSDSSFYRKYRIKAALGIVL